MRSHGQTLIRRFVALSFQATTLGRELPALSASTGPCRPLTTSAATPGTRLVPALGLLRAAQRCSASRTLRYCRGVSQSLLWCAGGHAAVGRAWTVHSLMRGSDQAASARRSSQQRFSAALAADMLWLPQGLQVMKRDISRELYFPEGETHRRDLAAASVAIRSIHPLASRGKRARP